MQELITTSNFAGGARLATMRTGTKELVNFRASFLGGSRFSLENRDLPGLVASMLLEGTKYHTKDELHALLESAGINLNITAGTSRVHISATFLKEKSGLFVNTLHEILLEPSFDQKCYLSLRTRAIASITANKKDTKAVALGTLTRKVFPFAHPHYIDEEIKRIELLQNTSVETLRHFYDHVYGLSTMKVSVVGDVEHKEFESLLKIAFDKWVSSNVKLVPDTSSAVNTRRKSDREIVTNIQDKESADAFFALPVRLDIRSLDLYALKVGLHILGGDFVSRLMSEVRVKQGLTYGTSSTLWKVADGDTGLILIWGTFAPTLLARGLSTTLAVLAKWINKGITTEELARAKHALVGGYKVGMASSTGLVEVLQYMLEHDLPLSYADDYPGVIESLTIKQVNKAIKDYSSQGVFVVSTAGSLHNPK